MRPALPALALALLAAAPVGASPVPGWLSETPPATRVRVLVEVTPEDDAPLAALRARTEAARAALLPLLVAGGARQLRTLWLTGALAMEAPAALVVRLAQRPEVVSVRLDERVRAPVTQRVMEPAEATWSHAAVGAPALWAEGLTGAGVVVAVMDSGVDVTHPALARRWRVGGWFDPYGEHATPHDASGHGTQVAGILVGAPEDGDPLGVAPDATFVAVRVFDDTGEGRYAEIHAGFEWLLDPDGDPSTDDAPDVVSASWGLEEARGRCIPEFQRDVQRLRAAGIVVVFAAGNGGPGGGTSVSPANDGPLAVGALDEDGALERTSARGPSACGGGVYPDLVAPGVGVWTTDLSLGGWPLYTTVAGTSFAAPHVAGVLALLREGLPDARVAVLETALRASAADRTAPGPDMDTGYGLVDGPAALARLTADSDADGSAAYADCDDDDAAVHPGAREGKPDGVDQDCNGHDLSLVVSARARGGVLRVTAASALGRRAALVLDGHGPMEFAPERVAVVVDEPRRGVVFGGPRGIWRASVRVGRPPGVVTVRGPEGALTVPVRLTRSPRGRPSAPGSPRSPARPLR